MLPSCKLIFGTEYTVRVVGTLGALGGGTISLILNLAGTTQLRTTKEVVVMMEGGCVQNSHPTSRADSKTFHL